MLGKLLRLAVALLALLGLLVVIVSGTPLVSWLSARLAGPWNDPSGAVLIVLGGGQLSDETLDAVSYWRAVYAALYWRQQHYGKIVVSGGGTAPLLKDFLVCHGVPAETIMVENRSNSTRENALETARLLAGTPGRKVLITTDVHVFRAGRAFHKAGLDVVTRPAPYGRREGLYWYRRWPAFLELARESVKIVYYWARGWI